MKLIRCHIENFGKFSDRSIEFHDGVNVFCESNGWGKTTLAAFILTMFYGFGSDTKRDKYENDRKRYEPWQGGTYGGQVTFEKEGRRFLLSRFFGAKPAEDRTELRDADTNLLLPGGSAQPGEDLFGIDRKSFCRTVFISQNDCAASTTDSIHAKLGNLADHTDDINNYDKAAERLDNLINCMSDRRATGRLYKMKNQLTALEGELRQCAGIEQALEELDGRIAEKKAFIERLKSGQKEFQQKRSLLSSYGDIKAKRDQYISLAGEVQVRKEAAERAAAAFPGRIPEAEEVDGAIRNCQQTLSLKESKEAFALDREEEELYRELRLLYAGEVPDEGLIDSAAEKARRLKSYRHALEEKRPDREEAMRLEELSARFEKRVPEEADFAEIRTALHEKEERKNSLNAKLSRYEMLASVPEPEAENNGAIIVIVISLLLMAAGAAGIFASFPAGMAGIAAGVLLLIVGILLKRKADADLREKKRAAEDKLRVLSSGIEEDKAAIEEVDRKTENFLTMFGIAYHEYDVNVSLHELKKDAESYKRLLIKVNDESIEKYEADIRLLGEELNRFLLRYGEPAAAEDDDCENRIYNIGRKAAAFSRLENRRNEYKRIDEEYIGYRKKVDGFLEEIGMTSGMPEGTEQPFKIRSDLQNSEQLLKIRSDLQNWEQCGKECREAEAQLAAFAAENDTEKLLGAAVPEEEGSMEELDEKINGILSGIDEANGVLRDYQRQADEYCEKRDELTEKENEYQRLQESYESGRKELELLKRTKEYLEKSRTSFTARYMEPIMSGYRKYYGMLAGESAGKFHIDADARLTVEESGMQREIRFLSTGYNDLIGICMRMALVDAMYREEKPFVVFDDPFANLDEEKTERGKMFLSNISDGYQVIYFTCHGGRV